MVECMKKVAANDAELTVEERNLISVAYKNVIGARRASWRIISSIEQKEESKGEAKHELTKQYRSIVSIMLYCRSNAHSIIHLNYFLLLISLLDNSQMIMHQKACMTKPKLA